MRVIILALAIICLGVRAEAMRFAVEPYFKFDQAGNVDVTVTESKGPGKSYTDDLSGQAWRFGSKFIVPVNQNLSIRPEIEFGHASSEERYFAPAVRVSGILRESRPTWGFKIAVRYWVGEPTKD